MSVKTVYVDVDLTLIDIDGKLLPHVEEMLPKLLLRYTLICWSAGGAEYAESILKRYDLKKYFTYVLDKPDIIIDDSPQGLLNSSNLVLIEKRDDWKRVWDKIFHKDTSLSEVPEIESNNYDFGHTLDRIQRKGNY